MSAGDPTFVELLRRLKTSLEHARRFGPDTVNNYRHAVVQAEGDIEEFLIDHGYQVSEEREPLNPPTTTEVEWRVAGHSMVSPVHRYNATPEGEAAARADYERLISQDHYLGGKQSGRLFRVTTIVNRMERNR